MNFCAQNDRLWIFSILTGCDPIHSFKGSGKGLMGRKSIAECNFNYTFLAVTHFFQCESQFSISQIIPKDHTGNSFEFPCHVKFRITQSLCKIMQCQRFILMLLYTFINLIHDYLNLLLPLKHFHSPSAATLIL